MHLGSRDLKFVFHKVESFPSGRPSSWPACYHCTWYKSFITFDGGNVINQFNLPLIKLDITELVTEIL